MQLSGGPGRHIDGLFPVKHFAVALPLLPGKKSLVRLALLASRHILVKVSLAFDKGSEKLLKDLILGSPVYNPTRLTHSPPTQIELSQPTILKCPTPISEAYKALRALTVNILQF